MMICRFALVRAPWLPSINDVSTHPRTVKAPLNTLCSGDVWLVPHLLKSRNFSINPQSLVPRVRGILRKGAFKIIIGRMLGKNTHRMRY